MENYNMDDFVPLAPSALQLYIEKAEWFCQQEKSLTFGYDLNSQYSMRISIDRETLLYDVYRLVWIVGGPVTELWDRNEPIGAASLQIITDALQARQIRETK